MKHSLEYAKTHMSVDIEDKNLSAVLHANGMETELKGDDEVVRAMLNPIGRFTESTQKKR
jgi:hypothetical protein